MKTSSGESSSSPVLDEHGSAQWCQFLCCHQLADEGMTLRVQTARLSRVAEQVRQELVVLGDGTADVLLPESGRVAVQLHRATAGGRGGKDKRESERERLQRGAIQSLGCLNDV